MSRITDYGFLFQTTFGTSKTNLVNNIQLSKMNSSSVQKQLKAAGIDTNSKKYKLLPRPDITKFPLGYLLICRKRELIFQIPRFP